MKIHFLGDSITFGYGLDNPQDGWQALLRQAMPEHEITTRGIPGDTTGGMLARFLPEVASDRPDYFHLMGGLNDIAFGTTPEQVRANIKAICHQADFYGIKPILGFCPLPVLSQVDKKAQRLMGFNVIHQKMNQLYDWLSEMNQISKAPVMIIDYEAEFAKRFGDKREHLYLDGVHLNEEGNRLMAEIFLEHFQK